MYKFEAFCSGYCFSASLPPFLAAAAYAGIDVIENEPSLILKLSHCCRKMHELLLGSDVIQAAYDYRSDCLSPVKHLVPKRSAKVGDSYHEKNEFLKKIVHLVSLYFLAFFLELFKQEIDLLFEFIFSKYELSKFNTFKCRN